MTLTPEPITNAQAALHILQWYVDHGVDEVLDGTPLNHFELKPAAKGPPQSDQVKSLPVSMQDQPQQTPAVMGVQARQEAAAAANNAADLKALHDAAKAFDGFEIKQTASNFVFADGNPQADIMVIIDAPAADDDRQGRPMAGADGALFDKAMACIGLSRQSKDASAAFYTAPIVNWRPPGNRSLTQSELATGLPFIERHIALVNPKVILVCGAEAAKTLLDSRDGISRLRKKQHQYTTLTADLQDKVSDIPCIATYPPSYILSAPAQKRAFWADLLSVQALLRTGGEGAQ